jgi:hypothetical protein
MGGSGVVTGMYLCRDKIAGSDFGQRASVGPQGRGQDARVNARDGRERRCVNGSPARWAPTVPVEKLKEPAVRAIDPDKTDAVSV